MLWRVVCVHRWFLYSSAIICHTGVDLDPFVHQCVARVLIFITPLFSYCTPAANPACSLSVLILRVSLLNFNTNTLLCPIGPVWCEEQFPPNAAISRGERTCCPKVIGTQLSVVPYWTKYTMILVSRHWKKWGLCYILVLNSEVFKTLEILLDLWQYQVVCSLYVPSAGVSESLCNMFYCSGGNNFLTSKKKASKAPNFVTAKTDWESNHVLSSTKYQYERK